MKRRELLPLLGSAALLGTAARSHAQTAPTVWVTTTEGKMGEGTLQELALTLEVGGEQRRLSPEKVLSIHSASAATASEQRRISEGMVAAAGTDRAAREAAVTDLTEMGLPVLTPLLASYKDTDAHEPDALYRLFGKIMPAHADELDRTLDMVRLVGGEVLRGRLSGEGIKLRAADGGVGNVALSSLRRIAFRRPVVERMVDLQALRHCTWIGWLDTGVGVTAESKLTSRAAGLVRLDFNEDGWSAGPDGLAKPLPGKRLLQEGQLWGTLMARVGPRGERWVVGTKHEKSGLPLGRLYYVINDNEHWQNNIGGYRAWLKVTNAYDLGDPA